MAQNHRIIEAIMQSEEPCVLATIIRVEGSAYRKEGAMMLLMADGIRIGLLSGGCLEHDLSARADEVLQGISRTIIYDMRAEDSFSWGSGAGCSGLVHVLLEPVRPALRRHMSMLKDWTDRGISVTGIKKLNEDDSVVDYLFIPHHGQCVFGCWDGEIPGDVYEEDRGIKLQKNGIYYMKEPSLKVFVQTFLPKRRLIVFGAGEDAKPLVEIAARIGFSVIVADWRPAYCNETHFPNAELLLIGFPSEIMQRLILRNEDSVVVMSHHFEQDKELLRLLLQYKLHYLGILGPRHRTIRLLDGNVSPDWVRSPVGLDIGADGPEEIAISIVAELIGAKRERVTEGVPT